MIRKGGRCRSPKQPPPVSAPIPVQSSSSLPFGALGVIGNGVNSAVERFSIDECPQCKATFNGSNCRPVQDSCGHFKCRLCFISNEDGCPQCLISSNGVQENGLSLTIAANENQHSRINGTYPTTQSFCVGQSQNMQHGHGSPEHHAKRNYQPLAPETSKSYSSILVELNTVAVAADSKASPECLRDESSPSSHANKSEQNIFSPGKSGNARSAPEFFTQGNSNEQNTKHAAVTNVQLTKTTSSERKSRNSRTEKNSVDFSSKADGSSKSSKSMFISRRSTRLSKKAGEKLKLVTSSLIAKDDNQSKSRKRARGLNSPSPPEETSSRPKIAYGRSSKKAKESLAPLRSSSSHQLPTSADTQLAFYDASDFSDQPGQSGHSKSRLVAFASDKVPSETSTNSSCPSLDFQKASTSQGLDPFATRPSSGIQSTEDENGCDLTKSTNLCESNLPQGMKSGEEGDGEPKDKKKKKRNPVVIHDHITVIPGDPTMFQCKVCNKKFKTKAHIKYHVFCLNGTKPFKCEECGQGFVAKSHYEYHVRIHTGERPYKCPKCGKGYNQRGKVNRHMRIHTGEKPFICVECGRGFASAQGLRCHHLIHTGERPFVCKYCQKRFTGMTNLKKHLVTHTGERPYVCTHCGKSFGLKGGLDVHWRTHSSERLYACDQCTLTFFSRNDLRRHLVTHSGEIPFKCWICGTAFRRKDNLHRHIKNSHNQPKEVAKQLADEAAAEYRAHSKQATVPISKANVISNAIKPTQFPQPGKTSDENKAGSSTSNNRDVTSRVIITAELSPPLESLAGNIIQHIQIEYMTNAYNLPDGDDSEALINSMDTSKIENHVEQQGDTNDTESLCSRSLNNKGLAPTLEDVIENENRVEQQGNIMQVLDDPESLNSLNNEETAPTSDDVTENEYRVEQHGDLMQVHLSNPTTTSYDTRNSNSWNDAARQPVYTKVNEDTYQQHTEYSRDVLAAHPSNYKTQPQASSSGSTSFDYLEWIVSGGYPVKIPLIYNVEEPQKEFSLCLVQL